MSRLDIRKTYKLFIAGEFPRSESGRSYAALDGDGNLVSRVAAASRKDLRDAVRAARSAFDGWAGRTAYNRGQVLYRLAEVLEDRRATYARQVAIESGEDEADRQVVAAIDRLVWYAGWADKYHQIVGNLNPVAGPFFNISVPEPTGVVGIIAAESPSLLGLMSRLPAVLVSGNTTVVLASERYPLPAATLAEAVATADVPSGVVNILTGAKAELVPWLASHMDVNAIDAWGADPEMIEAMQRAAADNVKRIVTVPDPPVDWYAGEAQSPYFVASFTEIKTVWHPKGL